MNVCSHSHHIRDARDARTPRTVIGDGVRIAHHATVLAGTTLAPDSMVGAGALVTRDTEPGTVHVGVPASSPWTKPREHRERRGAGPARRDEGGIAALFAGGATQSEALDRQNV